MAELKTIQYAGINRAVPQSMAPAGSCQEIINARFRKGCWRPVGAKVPYTINGNAVDITEIIDEVYLHDIENGRIPGEPNWIGYSNADGKVYLLDPTDAESGLLITTITDKSNVSIVFLKRTMIVCSGDGVKVFLFNGDKAPYYLETAALPVPDVDLGIKTTESLTTACDDLDDYKVLSSFALGKYFEALNEKSQQYGMLRGSIMYITAYRMFDGSYILPSIPRYFRINESGSVKFTNTYQSGNRVNFTLTFSSLNATINNELYPASIGESKALIESICVFATKTTPIHLIDETTVNESLLLRNIPAANYNSHTKDSIKQFKEIFPVNPDFSKLAASASWYKIHEFNFEEVVGKTGKTTKEIDLKGFYQDYATREILIADQFTHHSLSARSAMVYNDRLHLLNIKTSFGKPYVQWEDTTADMGIASTTAGSITVWLKTSLGEAVISCPLDVPGFISTTEIQGTIFDNEGQAQAELDMHTSEMVSGYINKIEGQDPQNYQITTVVSYQAIWKVASGVSSTNAVLPSVVGYNDARAYKIQIVVDGKLLLGASLQKNSLMNFAYWHNTAFSPDQSSSNANYQPVSKDFADLSFPSAPVADKGSIFDTNRLQVSEIQNPLIFPAKYSYQIGTGDGITMAAGSEPLSTGQFGQFPLQVFTTKGVWCLEIGLGDVLYTNVLPSSSEVIENRKNVISVGSGVVYSTHNGLFVLNGRQSTELGQIIEGNPAIAHLISEIDTLIEYGAGNTHFTPGLSESLSTVDFLAYLQNSSIGFDYDNKELIVTNANYNYSYIYSFESKFWFKISQSFTKLINSYPKLLGVTTNSIVSISQESESQEVEVMFISNAQSFDAPDSYKLLDRFIQRIKFGTAGIKITGIYLFASNDLVTWQSIVGRQRTGSYIKDLLVQRTHGSAKYYVVVLNGTMKPDSEIKQIETLVKIKWNNCLR